MALDFGVAGYAPPGKPVAQNLGVAVSVFGYFGVSSYTVASCFGLPGFPGSLNLQLIEAPKYHPQARNTKRFSLSSAQECECVHNPKNDTCNLLRPVIKLILFLLVPYGYIIIKIKKEFPKEMTDTALGTRCHLFGISRAHMQKELLLECRERPQRLGPHCR